MSRTARRTSWLIAISGVFAGTFAVAEGCGSDSFTTSPSTDGGQEGATDAGQDAGPQDSGPAVVADACVKPPTAADGTLQPFCDAYADISSRCLDCASCRQSNATACEGLGGTLSASLRNGIVACKDTIACSALDSQVGFVQDPCVVAHLLDGGVSNTQLNAQNAYCTKCGGDAGTPEYADCAENYFGQPDGGSNAPGALVLVSSDGVTAKIQKNCVDCPGYGGCSVFYFCISAGTDACTGSNALCHN